MSNSFSLHTNKTLHSFSSFNSPIILLLGLVDLVETLCSIDSFTSYASSFVQFIHEWVVPVCSVVSLLARFVQERDALFSLFKRKTYWFVQFSFHSRMRCLIRLVCSQTSCYICLVCPRTRYFVRSLHSWARCTDLFR